ECIRPPIYPNLHNEGDCLRDQPRLHPDPATLSHTQFGKDPVSMELEDTGSSHLRRVVRQEPFYVGGVPARRPGSGAVVRCRRCRRPLIRRG
ncbi:hypothetical protein Hamer_G012652, partial [Homarus americanus]